MSGVQIPYHPPETQSKRVRQGAFCHFGHQKGLAGARHLALRRPHGLLAQLVERLVYTENVGGSSPSRPTIFPFLYNGSAFNQRFVYRFAGLRWHLQPSKVLVVNGLARPARDAFIFAQVSRFHRP